MQGLNNINITAHIETAPNGWFSIYHNEDLPFGFFGEGQTEEEAKQNFIDTFNAMNADYYKENGVVLNVTIRFVYDISALLKKYNEYISLAGLSKLTGINKGQLSQYACGYRKPKPKQVDKIITALNSFGRELMDIRIK